MFGEFRLKREAARRGGLSWLHGSLSAKGKGTVAGSEGTGCAYLGVIIIVLIMKVQQDPRVEEACVVVEVCIGMAMQ